MEGIHRFLTCERGALNMGGGLTLPVVLSVLWALAMIGVLLGASDPAPGWLVWAALLVLPIGLLWAVLIPLQVFARNEERIAALETELEGLRASDITSEVTERLEALEAARTPRPAESRGPEPKPVTEAPTVLEDEAPELPLQVEEPVAAPSPAPQPEEIPEPEVPAPPSLPMETPQDHFDLSADICIRALQFPLNGSDKEGFAALKQAVRDHSMAKLLQSAEDVLNLLSQEGIYTDDLEAEPVAAEAWKAYALGSRSAVLDQVLGERDPTQHALVLERTRADIVFRDTALHFLRRFEAEMPRLFRGATEAQVAELMNTRTARAFILLGRVSGTLEPRSEKA